MSPLSTREDVLSWLLAQGLRPTGVCADSRRVRAGDLYVAEVPESGARAVYVRDALANGACAVLWADDLPLCAAEFGSAAVVAVSGLHALVGPVAQQVYGNPSEKLRVLAVTGTNGKTTITQWLAQTMPGRCAVIGTLGAGYPEAMVATGFTTPDAAQYAHLLADFVEDGATACAVEASSIGIAEARMAGSHVDCAVFTNLTRDHLDYHKTMEAYAAAKACLFGWPDLRAAVINYDDPFGRELLDGTTASLVLAYGLSTRPADLPASVHWVGADAVVPTAQGLSATLVFGDERLPLVAHVIGRHNLSNLLAVAAVLIAQGLSPAEIVVHLARLQPPAGRMACQGGEHMPLVVVDYAHTPDALRHILAALRDVATARGGRLVCVFGCGGDRDPGKRPEMGRAAAQGADHVVVTSDNPRWEVPAEIIRAIVAGVPEAVVIEDRAAAIANAIAEATEADVVLLAGKGHELDQEIRGQRYPFDDTVHARKALALWASRPPSVAREVV
jgi:UDP-N-acetylmuramoyl-L-alanyl-D-glutamate--2,6-diaminopimelate ligase